MPLAQQSGDVQLDWREDGRVLAMAGRLTVARAGHLETALETALEGKRGFAIDLSRVERMDTVGAWIVHKLRRDCGATVVNASGDADRLLREVDAADKQHRLRDDPRSPLVRALGEFGAYLAGVAHVFGQGLAFIGEVAIAAWNAVTARRGVRTAAIWRQIEVSGVAALGIVGLMSFLVGMVLAQQGAVQLRQFGLDTFVINLVGRSVFRELGILLTAIMVAGRSASAFAAQIGSMKLNEEIDAMRTIGLDPIEVLVLPRIIAMVIMLPLLGFFASVLAVTGGGLFAWVSLNIPPVAFVTQLRDVVPMSDFWIGLIKAPVFGMIIATVGCFQGLQVTGNAESVGLRTTAAVVQSIFLVIVMDALFAVFFTAIGFV